MPSTERRGAEQVFLEPTVPGEHRLRVAIAYLTLLPVRRTTCQAGSTEGAPGRSVVFFPWVGAVIGAMGAVVYMLSVPWLGHLIAAALVAAGWTLITGVLRETGRSHVGQNSRTVAIVAALGLIRWQAVLAMLGEGGVMTSSILMAFVAVQAVPRAGIVALAWTARPAGSGTGFAISQSLRSGAAFLAILEGLLIAVAGGGLVFTSLLLLLGYLTIRLLSALFYANVGGVNGDGLGLAEQILEAAALVLLGSIAI